MISLFIEAEGEQLLRDSVAGAVAYGSSPAMVASLVSVLAAGDHLPQVPEVLHVQVGRERVQQHGGLVAGVGEGVRGAGGTITRVPAGGI